MSAIASPGPSGNASHTGAATARPTTGGVVPLPRGRRNAELIMLVFAVGVVLFAYASVGFGLNGKLPSGMLAYGLAFTAIVGIAHIAVRRLAPWADPLLLPLAALLNGLGIVMIYRLQQSGRNGDAGNRISTITSSTTAVQVLWSAVGIAAFIATLAIIRQPRMLQRYTYTFGAIGLVLLAIPAVLPNSMSEVNGAKVWISIGGFSIQPGEFAKLALAVFFAGYLVTKRDVLSLAGLDGEPADADPHLGAVDLAHRVRQHGGDGEQHQADRAEGVGVTLEHPGLPDDG